MPHLHDFPAEPVCGQGEDPHLFRKDLEPGGAGPLGDQPYIPVLLRADMDLGLESPEIHDVGLGEGPAGSGGGRGYFDPVSYTHLRAHET